MNILQDFRNQKTIFRNQEYTTCLVELLIPSTILKAKYNLNNPIVKKTYLVQVEWDILAITRVCLKTK